MTSVSPTGGLHVTLLVDEDRTALERLLNRDRVGSLYLRSLVHEYGITPTGVIGHGRFFGASRNGDMEAVAFLGNARNLTTMGGRAELEPVLERVSRADGAPRLFVGPAEHAPLIRGLFARSGAAPFLDRAQAYYVLTARTLADLEPLPIRPATEDDLDVVSPAHAAMTEEDLRVPRYHLDLRRLREISKQRIEAGKVWVVMDGKRLVFKTEEAALAEDGILIGGVYTDPDYRGRGYASRAIATWARGLLDGGMERLTLHVNAANTPAVKAYERAGFKRYSMLRLMLAY